MAEHRRSRGRKLGSSRKIMKKLEVEETKAEEAEEDLYVNEMMEKLHNLFSEDDESKNIFVTRADMEKVSSITFYNVEDLEQLFDGLNPEGNEFLNYEEFEPGLRKFIQSNPWNQKRKRRSKKRIEFTNFPSLEEADFEEKKQFMSFMEQLGANNIFEDETEIWKLWTKLAHDEPYLLENLEEFLAKVTSQIKEARREKETLEVVLQKRIAAHTEEVQHLYEEMEQQMNAERIKLLNESDARSSIHSKEMKEVLDVKNNEVQQLVGVQDELERELHKLRSMQQVTKTENEKLKRTNQDLDQQLEKIRNQLSEAQSCLSDMQQKIDQNDNEKEKKEAEESTTVLDSQQFYQIFFQDQSLKNKSDAEQITTEPIQEHESAELALQTSSNIPKISSRTRVISIEEDPMPEYLTRDYKVFEKTTAKKTASFSLLLSRETLFEEEQNIHENYTKTEEHKLYDVQSNDSLEIELMNEMKTQEDNPISSYDDLHSIDSTKVTASHISVLLHSPPPVKAERFMNTFSLKTNSLRLDDQKAQLHQTQNLELNSGVKNEKTAVITSSLDKTKLQDGSSLNTTLLFEFESKKDGNQKDAAEQINSQRDSVKYRAERSKQDSPKINKETHQSLDSFEKKKPFQDISDADHVYKIMVVGNSNVGKTSFLQQVHGGSFPTNTSATIGLDYRIKNLIVDNKQYVLQLWDTAGQERFHSVTGQFFRKADGIVIMYDVTSKDSFNAACYWLKCIKEKTEEDIVILLIGNKIDCDSERKVAPEEGEKLAQENKLLFTECSAASGINITESLRQLARSLKAHEDYMKNNVVKIERSNKKKNKSCCM